MAASSIVVRLPAEVDLTNAAAVGEELARAVGSGARMVVADLSATTFCDSAAIRTLLGAADDAAASGAELRLVVPDSGPVRRIIDLLGLGQVLPVDPTLPAALSGRG
jgi:anti-sigma B factor antagonist